MLKSILFSLLLIVSSVLGAAPAAERINIEARLCSLSINQADALIKALDIGIFMLLPEDWEKVDAEVYNYASDCIARLAALNNFNAAREMGIPAIHPPVTEESVCVLITNYVATLRTLMILLSEKISYQSLFIEQYFSSTGKTPPNAFQLTAYRYSQGKADDQGVFTLDPETDATIGEFFSRYQKIINNLAVLLLGEQPAEGIFKMGNKFIVYIKNSYLLIEWDNPRTKIRPIEFFEEPGCAAYIRKSTYVFEEALEGNSILNRKRSYLVYHKPQTIVLGKEGASRHNSDRDTVDYHYIPGDPSPSHHQKRVLLPEDGKPFDFAANLFDPIAIEGTLQEAIVALPSTKTEKLLLEIHFLEGLLGGRKAQATSTALIPLGLAEEIQVLETTLEEKQAELQQAFVEENPTFIETAKKVSEDLYEYEWAQRKDQVAQGNVGATKNQKKKNAAKFKIECAEREKNKTQLLQEKQNEIFRQQLDTVKKEAQGKFKHFYQGVKSFFQSKGIDVALTQTGNSGSHTGKIEFTTQGASAGSIIVPNKKITKGLLGAICDEIGNLSERLIPRP